MPIRPENKARYPANWKEISHDIRFKRACGRCECKGICGRGTHRGRCPNRHGHAAYGTGSKVVLTTAHLNHIPEDCEDGNLMAMCQGCHLHYDRDHHAETRRKNKLAKDLHTSVAACLLGERYTHDVTTVADLVVPWLLRNYEIARKAKAA